MKHWFITGVSRGFGFALAKAALARGDKVVGTVRGEAPNLPHKQGQLCILKVDLADEQRVVNAVEQAFAAFGRIDVIVNNAGYGVLGAVESSTDGDLRDLFNVNVFTPIRIVRAALPYLREQGSGYILNITSIAGRAPGVGSALYAATKYALEGFSTALAPEVAPLGIKVTAVAPGQFRTDFLSENSVRKQDDQAAAYASTVGAALESLVRLNHNQLGDPDLAASCLIDLVNAQEPPLNLLLGSDALERAHRKMDAMLAEMQAWAGMSLSTDFKQN